MKLYLDSSVLAAYYTPEAHSEPAESMLRAAPAPAVSDLSELELFSALSAKVERAELALDDARRIQAVFLGHLEDGLFTRVAVGRSHYRLAREWAGRGFGAPTPSGSLHLAIASLEGRTLASADPSLLAAAGDLGVATVPLATADDEAPQTVHEGTSP
ncbi:MAG: type II toxin-antitoxin system VapC family toxin [Acidobacteriota bacterium]